MESTFEKLEYNNSWGQYADIEESSVPVTKVIVKNPLVTTVVTTVITVEPKKKETLQTYHVSNKLTKFQYCIIAIFLYITFHIILII